MVLPRPGRGESARLQILFKLAGTQSSDHPRIFRGCTIFAVPATPRLIVQYVLKRPQQAHSLTHPADSRLPAAESSSQVVALVLGFLVYLLLLPGYITVRPLHAHARWKAGEKLQM